MQNTYITVICKSENSKKKQRQGRRHVEWSRVVCADSTWERRFAGLLKFPLSVGINVIDCTKERQALFSGLFWYCVAQQLIRHGFIWRDFSSLQFSVKLLDRLGSYHHLLPSNTCLLI